MSAIYTRSYVQNLERAVIEELLPIYRRWHDEHNIPIVESRLPQELRDVSSRKQIAALFKPPQN